MSDAEHAALRRDPSHAPQVSGRDTDLDDFRAFVLIWVLALHCLYWFGLIAPRWNVWKSWTLCEMPVLFFIAGASNSLGLRAVVAVVLHITTGTHSGAVLGLRGDRVGLRGMEDRQVAVASLRYSLADSH